MSGHSEEAVKQQVRVYRRVFLALMALTAVTVAVSYLHLPILWAVGAALFIATVKGSLVAGFFMHLSTEKKIIFCVLVLAAVFFVFLLVTPSWHSY